MITQELAAYGYLIAAICFIMALRGLSSPVTSRQGNFYGVVSSNEQGPYTHERRHHGGRARDNPSKPPP